jgi:hypothetical protein
MGDLDFIQRNLELHHDFRPDLRPEVSYPSRLPDLVGGVKPISELHGEVDSIQTTFDDLSVMESPICPPPLPCVPESSKGNFPLCPKLWHVLNFFTVGTEGHHCRKT